jgi:CDP-paratose 2-epimerase
MRILVTGVCGFVGSTIAAGLAERDSGAEVFGVDNLARPGSELNRTALPRAGIRVLHGDLRCASDVDELPPADVVVDAAAVATVLAGTAGHGSPRQLFENNLVGTLNVLEYCRRHRAGLVLLSSSRVYSIEALGRLPVEAAGTRFRLRDDAALFPGFSARGLTEDFLTRPPLSPYGASKLASEILALEYGETFGLPVWIDRCGLLAGAGQFGRPDQGIVAFWIHAWARRHPLRYTGLGGRGLQVRDVLHPRDLVPLVEKQAASAASGGPRVLNLSGGVEGSLSLRELSDWCTERFGPHLVAAEPEDRRFDVPWLVLDSSLAKAAWDWAPTISLATILEEIAQHAEADPCWLERSGVS